ncbi:MAG: glycosyltransferase family 2 protein [Lachnospiraceae bacterium]
MNEKKIQTSQSVLIVILNYRTYELTIELIKKLHNLNYGNYDVMVVDNCSPNGSAAILEEKSNELNFIFYANKENAGYATGNNIGIRYAYEHSYDYTWILNNDVIILDQNVLQYMVDTIQKHKNVAVIGPKIITRDNTVCAPYCRRPTFKSLTYRIVTERNYRRRFNDTPRKVYRVYGCCMLLDTKKMHEVDYMDERTFLYGEEDILAERLLKKGYVAYYDPEVCVKHNESSSMKAVPKEKQKSILQARAKSRELYLSEYRGFCKQQIAMVGFVADMIAKIRG